MRQQGPGAASLPRCDSSCRCTRIAHHHLSLLQGRGDIEGAATASGQNSRPRAPGRSPGGLWGKNCCSDDAEGDIRVSLLNQTSCTLGRQNQSREGFNRADPINGSDKNQSFSSCCKHKPCLDHLPSAKTLPDTRGQNTEVKAILNNSISCVSGPEMALTAPPCPAHIGILNQSVASCLGSVCHARKGGL